MALKAWRKAETHQHNPTTTHTFKKKKKRSRRFNPQPGRRWVPLETLCGESHVYLVPDTLIGVNSYSTEGGQDTGGDLCYTVVVVRGGEAQDTSGP